MNNLIVNRRDGSEESIDFDFKADQEAEGEVIKIIEREVAYLPDDWTSLVLVIVRKQEVTT